MKYFKNIKLQFIFIFNKKEKMLEYLIKNLKMNNFIKDTKQLIINHFNNENFNIFKNKKFYFSYIFDNNCYKRKFICDKTNLTKGYNKSFYNFIRCNFSKNKNESNPQKKFQILSKAKSIYSTIKDSFKKYGKIALILYFFLYIGGIGCFYFLLEHNYLDCNT